MTEERQWLPLTFRNLQWSPHG